VHTIVIDIALFNFK